MALEEGSASTALCICNRRHPIYLRGQFLSSWGTFQWAYSLPLIIFRWARSLTRVLIRTSKRSVLDPGHDRCSVGMLRVIAFLTTDTTSCFLGANDLFHDGTRDLARTPRGWPEQVSFWTLCIFYASRRERSPVPISTRASDTDSHMASLKGSNNTALHEVDLPEQYTTKRYISSSLAIGRKHSRLPNTHFYHHWSCLSQAPAEFTCSGIRPSITSNRWLDYSVQTTSSWSHSLVLAMKPSVRNLVVFHHMLAILPPSSQASLTWSHESAMIRSAQR